MNKEKLEAINAEIKNKETSIDRLIEIKWDIKQDVWKLLQWKNVPQGLVEEVNKTYCDTKDTILNRLRK